jgi:hypothetical protein
MNYLCELPLLFAATLLLSGANSALRVDPADPGARGLLRKEAVQIKEKWWINVSSNGPKDNDSARGFMGYALSLAEAGEHRERLAQVLEIEARMQDRDPASKTFGNLKWRWGDPGVSDENAVEFCMFDALILWHRHKDWLPEDAQRQLRDIMQTGMEACLRHRVKETYTNIALLNAGNLLLLGELFEKPAVSAEGKNRFNAVAQMTFAHGTHEFCSPTYYGIDLGALMLIATQCVNKEERHLAKEMLQLLWTDIALNWFPAAERMGGCNSRTYDYLSGLGDLDWYLWVNGWFKSPTPGKAEQVEPFWKEWSPPESLRKMSLEDLPRLVRQSWGDRLGQSRTQMMYPDIALSVIGANYGGEEDVPFVADLPGPRAAPRCYFIADDKNNPYGTLKFKTEPGAHLKAHHSTFFWIGAQRTCDAVGMAIFRNHELESSDYANLKSNFVLRRDAQSVWLSGKPLKDFRTAAKPETSIRRISIPPYSDSGNTGQAASGRTSTVIKTGDSLVLRYGTAALGVRVLIGTTRDGRPAKVSLVDDGNPYGCLRVCIEHGLENSSKESANNAFSYAAAGFWIRVGSGLRGDAAFDAWRKAFDAALPAKLDFGRKIAIEVPGKDGPIKIAASAANDRPAAVRIEPEPCRTALELNGKQVEIQ